MLQFSNVITCTPTILIKLVLLCQRLSVQKQPKLLINLIGICFMVNPRSVCNLVTFNFELFLCFFTILSFDFNSATARRFALLRDTQFN